MYPKNTGILKAYLKKINVAQASVLVLVLELYLLLELEWVLELNVYKCYNLSKTLLKRQETMAGSWMKKQVF